jgi:hypothetical protein
MLPFLNLSLSGTTTLFSFRKKRLLFGREKKILQQFGGRMCCWPADGMQAHHSHLHIIPDVVGTHG